ncbi:MAG: ABC transporter ATP-binding protein [Candidatus Heimdallarchaeum endolithica]|uniref:ABC transporter ATP-binding protein n=1 Tax=Candidatus Heimdallarchaeum endolithica TaxID=2876572 RepID=A0A9Y1BQ64_9ARCH|nr:MAG: ABC transporter ATP-binding protein [Candidatus Heimdallarchaeum endolithica]
MISSNNKLDSRERRNKVVLLAEDLIKIYRTGESETQALRGVSLKVHEGEKVFLIGPSGSGKTTLVNILAGIDKPTSGKVFWEDLREDITRSSHEAIIKNRRNYVGVIFQDSKLIPHLTVEENIRLTAHYANLDSDETEKRLEFILKFMGIWEKRNKKQNKLSGGEQKRAAIASTLITNPRIIIGDEPTGNLDIVTSNKILDLLDKINVELNVALLIVTHSQLVAQRADRIIEFSDGVILAQHSKNIQLRELKRTRELEMDRQNRIHIPQSILEELNNPKHFTINLENKKIVLRPIYQQEDERENIG